MWCYARQFCCCLADYERWVWFWANRQEWIMLCPWCTPPQAASSELWSFLRTREKSGSPDVGRSCPCPLACFLQSSSQPKGHDGLVFLDRQYFEIYLCIGCKSNLCWKSLLLQKHELSQKISVHYYYPLQIAQWLKIYSHTSFFKASVFFLCPPHSYFHPCISLVFPPCQFKSIYHHFLPPSPPQTLPWVHPLRSLYSVAVFLWRFPLPGLWSSTTTLH